MYSHQKNPTEENKKPSKLQLWLKRVGIGGLIFFTVKGIVWLFIFYFAGSELNSCLGE